MLEITAIVLTYNEEIHIERCIRNLQQLTPHIVIVDSHSTDATCQLAERLGATVVPHDWPGNQADQFNWALDHLDIRTEWILRLDADEYLLPPLIDEIRERLPGLSPDVAAISLPRARAFMGRVLKHGIVNSVDIVRIFRQGKARYEQRLMDEHLVISGGEVVRFKEKFIDDNRTSLEQFTAKHNNYASREAAILLDAEFGLTLTADGGAHGADVEKKRSQKSHYARLPLFWRAAAYFFYRYFLRLGCLDGTEGFIWDFLQGWWYRTLVDAKVLEVKKACGNDKEKIRAYLKKNFDILI